MATLDRIANTTLMASSLDSHFYAKTIYIILHAFTIVYEQKLVANGGTFAVSTASTKAE